MRYDKDNDIIKKLYDNVNGSYGRLNKGDADYINITFSKCDLMERFLEYKKLIKEFDDFMCDVAIHN